MTFKLFCLLTGIAFVGLNCNNSGSGGFWPLSTGNESEILVVIDQKKWDSEIGNSLKSLLSKEITTLPQSEPEFGLVQINTKSFSKLVETHRNILKVEISPEYKKSVLEIKHNVWAKPQILITLKAPSDSSIVRLVSEKKSTIFDSFVSNEQRHYLTRHQKFTSAEIKRILQQKKIDLMIPEGFKMEVNKTNFCWIEHNTRNLTQGILIFILNGTNKKAFNESTLLSYLDSALKQNVPGPVKGSYLQTDKTMTPSFQNFQIGNNPSFEIKGLWSTKNYAMGGPFSARIITDTKNNRLVYLFGFIYAPKLPKRKYMRQLDAIFSSLKIG
jgi:hypothetical protein